MGRRQGPVECRDNTQGTAVYLRCLCTAEWRFGDPLDLSGFLHGLHGGAEKRQIRLFSELRHLEYQSKHRNEPARFSVAYPGRRVLRYRIRIPGKAAICGDLEQPRRLL